MEKTQNRKRDNRHWLCQSFKIGDKVKAIKTSLTEEQACIRAGIPDNQVSKWRRIIKAGHGNIHLDHAIRLAKAYEISLDWLADDDRTDDPRRCSEVERELAAAIKRLGPERALRRLLMIAEDTEPAPKAASAGAYIEAEVNTSKLPKARRKRVNS